MSEISNQAWERLTLPADAGEGAQALVRNAKNLYELHDGKSVAIDNDPSVPVEGRPELRRRVAEASHEKLAELEGELLTAEARLQVAEYEHAHQRKTDIRQTEVRQYLAGLDVGKRAAVLAKAVESGDDELLASVVNAPLALGLVDEDLRRRAADALDRKGAEALERSREHLSIARSAFRLAANRINRDGSRRAKR